MNSNQLLEQLLQFTVWLPIKNYKNYEVSICGMVRNITTKRILKPGVSGIDGQNYYAVNLCKNGNIKQYKIHRLVANTFIPKIDNMKNYIDHVDCNRFNNTVSNLRWCTQQENCFNHRLNKNNTTGIKGLYFKKNSQKWHAYIKFNYKKIHIGCYENIDDAKIARQAKAKELFGDFINSCEK